MPKSNLLTEASRRNAEKRNHDCNKKAISNRLNSWKAILILLQNRELYPTKKIFPHIRNFFPIFALANIVQ